MTKGRPRGQAPELRCDECATSYHGTERQHKEGVFHRHNKRIRALLNNHCLTYQEIGDRLGVTRERIHQIYEGILKGDGRKRRHTCTINKPRPIVMPAKHCLSVQLKPVCELHGLTFGFVCCGFFHNHAKPSEAIINGRICLLRKSQEQRGYVKVRRPKNPREDSEFLLLRLPDARWMIIPKDKWPKTSTLFSDMPNRDNVGFTKHCRHDWPDHIENWTLLQ